MFIIPSKLRSSEKNIYVDPLLPAVLVFVAFMIIISLSWRTARNDVVLERANTVADKAAFIESTLAQRFSLYEDTLRSAAALFGASDSVTRDEWTGFVTSLKLNERYPGIRGLGYIKLVSPAEKTAAENTARSEGVANFTIFPEGGREQYAPLYYVVPLQSDQYTDRTAPALGFDMYSDPERRETMELAMTTGQPTLSDVVDLVQDGPPLQGFLLYAPLYRKNMPVTTLEEREAAIEGYFYAAFIADDIFRNLFGAPEQAFNFSIHDGPPENSNLLFASNKEARAEFREERRNPLNMYEQDWTIVYHTTNEIVPIAIRTRPFSVATGGTIFSAVLAALIYLLIQRRTRSLAYAEQKELEAAKDELLSLASHQLRTPATAVKQYVSMVKEGFAGRISEEQQRLLQMAYESNERQLTIVDDLLYVARVDSGQATLKIERVELTKMLRSVYEDQKSVIKERSQKVVLSGLQKKVYIEADPHYLRMIFENLLSNASKYSHPKTKIIVDLKGLRTTVAVTVTDSGVGISPENFPDVFQKFSRIPNELTRQTAGSGIGLYLSKQLALLHGGDITLISVEDKGSSFTVTLPRRQKKEAKTSKK